MAIWSNWANIRGSSNPVGVPGAIGATIALGGSVAFLNSHLSGGTAPNATTAFMNDFARGFRGRIHQDGRFDWHIHAVALGASASNADTHGNMYTFGLNRTWGLDFEFSNDASGNTFGNEVSRDIVTILGGSAGNGTALYANPGTLSNNGLGWNNTIPNRRAWFQRQDSFTVPAGIRNTWRRMRITLSTEQRIYVPDIVVVLNRDFFPELYRPMASRRNGVFRSLDNDNGFLNTRQNGAFAPMALLEHRNSGQTNVGSSRTRHNGQFVQQALIGQVDN